MNLQQTVLGIELGSTRIKAVLLNREHIPVASGSFDWENKLVNGVWTYDMEDIHHGLQACFRDLAADVEEKLGQKLTTTGAIGMIKIINCQSHRGGVRINILCGSRALMDYNKKQDSVTAVSVALSAKQDLIADAVLKQKEDMQRQQERINTLQAQYLELLINTLPAPSKSQHALLFVDRMDTIALRNTVNQLVETYPGYCAVFSGSDEAGYSFIAGSKQKDCKELAQKLRESFGAKCGGNTPMIQGSVMAGKTELTALILQ